MVVHTYNLSLWDQNHEIEFEAHLGLKCLKMRVGDSYKVESWIMRFS